jgi:integrase
MSECCGILGCLRCRVRLPAFMSALDSVPGLGAVALRLLILTALRSGEIRQARWSWLSFDGVPTLTVPGEVMKGKKAADVRPHRVPLSDLALETLASAYTEANGITAKAHELMHLAPLMREELIFPSAKRTTPLSDMALSAVMRRMNKDRPDGALPPWRDPDGREAVPHGFRASFSTWVDDTRPEEREAAERALGHEIANRVSGTYRRSDLFERRVPLMRDWSALCLPGAGQGEYRDDGPASSA